MVVERLWCAPSLTTAFPTHPPFGTALPTPLLLQVSHTTLARLTHTGENHPHSLLCSDLLCPALPRTALSVAPLTHTGENHPHSLLCSDLLCPALPRTALSVAPLTHTGEHHTHSPLCCDLLCPALHWGTLLHYAKLIHCIHLIVLDNTSALRLNLTFGYFVTLVNIRFTDH